MVDNIENVLTPSVDQVDRSTDLTADREVTAPHGVLMAAYA